MRSSTTSNRSERASQYHLAIGFACVVALMAGVMTQYPMPWLAGGAVGLLVVALSSLRSLVADKAPAPHGENRGLARIPLKFDATLDWNDQDDGARSVPVKGINISWRGASVFARQPIAVGSKLFINIKSHDMMGVAHVRHCTPHQNRSGYYLGLEFRNPLMRAESGSWTISCQKTPE